MLKKMMVAWKETGVLWRSVAILEVISICSVLGILITLPNFNIGGPLCIVFLISMASAYVVYKLAMKYDPIDDGEGEQM